MNNKTWAWAVGGAIFIMIAGVWLWQLPNIIKHTAKGEDEGLTGIISLFGGAKAPIGSDLAQTQTQLDANLKKMEQAIKAQEVRAATIQDLKNKLDNKNNVQAAAAPPAKK